MKTSSDATLKHQAVTRTTHSAISVGCIKPHPFAQAPQTLAGVARCFDLRSLFLGSAQFLSALHAGIKGRWLHIPDDELSWVDSSHTDEWSAILVAAADRSFSV